MIIRVNRDYRITSTPSCWQVEKCKGKRKDGTPRWEPITFHSDFKSALATLGELRIRLIDSSVPSEILAAIEAIKKEAMTALDLFRESNG